MYHRIFVDISIAKRVRVFISKAALYMTKAGVALKIFYPNLIHVICFAHAVHRFTEEIWNKFMSAYKLIFAVNKVFLKAPSRIQTYREQLPTLPLPPESVITRWGTWIKSSSFYSEHFMEIKGIINQLNNFDTLLISDAKKNLKTHQYNTI